MVDTANLSTARRDELLAIIAQQQVVLAEQQAVIAGLQATVAELHGTTSGCWTRWARTTTRGMVLRFLHDQQVEPTNNTAERALRPAVIARKVSQCSKTNGGADSFAAFVSLCQTLGQRGIPPVAGLTALFRSGQLPLPSASR